MRLSQGDDVATVIETERPPEALYRFRVPSLSSGNTFFSACSRSWSG